MTIPSPPPTAAQPQSASSQAITALVLGILGIVCCQICAPIAWYMANNERKAIREGRAPAAGEGIALVGYILGIIGTILLALWLVWIFFFGGMAILTALGQHR